MTESEWHQRIVCDPDLHHGEPSIRGTHIPVAVVVATLADLTIDDLLKEYGQLSRQDVQAVLFYAAEAAQNTLVA